MRKVIFQMSVSIDGYIEGPNREIDWHIVDDEFGAYVGDLLRKTEVLIMGRRTYELMAGYWPTAENNDYDFKNLLNETPKLVFSRTLKSVSWCNSQLAKDTISEEIARLKRIPGDGLLWVGSSDLASCFLDQGLIDELRFIVTPVLLGAGHAVFSEITSRQPLRHLWSKTFQSGDVVLAYEPASR